MDDEDPVGAETVFEIIVFASDVNGPPLLLSIPSSSLSKSGKYGHIRN
jgi:hypothetical protein